MQGRNSNILTSSDKIESFRAKLVLWNSHAVNGSNEMFPNVMAADSEKKVQALIHFETLGAFSRKNELLFS